MVAYSLLILKQAYVLHSSTFFAIHLDLFNYSIH